MSLLERKGSNIWGVNNGILFEAQNLPASAYDTDSIPTFNARWRVNPLCLIVRLSYSSNTAYSCTVLYNPRNRTISNSQSRSGVGNIILQHNLNITTYSVTGSGSGGNYAYVSSTERNANSCRIFINDDASTNDYQVDVFIYDYGHV